VTFTGKGISVKLGEVDYPTGSSPPHIIYILADDMGWNDAGFNGGASYTPYMDSLASTGIILSKFYTLHLCTPTRGSLLTGVCNESITSRPPSRPSQHPITPEPPQAATPTRSACSMTSSSRMVRSSGRLLVHIYHNPRPAAPFAALSVSSQPRGAWTRHRS
jgi:hypothetical protein